jgi:hypothetical protein
MFGLWSPSCPAGGRSEQWLRMWPELETVRDCDLEQGDPVGRNNHFKPKSRTDVTAGPKRKQRCPHRGTGEGKVLSRGRLHESADC